MLNSRFDEPILNRQIESQKRFLREYVAVPVKHHLPFVARQPERHRRHRIRMMDVDDVIVLGDPPEPRDHRRRDHGFGRLDQSPVAEYPPVRIKPDDLRPPPVASRAHHIALHPLLRKPHLREPRLRESFLRESFLREPHLREPRLREPLLREPRLRESHSQIKHHLLHSAQYRVELPQL